MAHLSTLYDQDFHAWALQSAELIRTGQLDQLDLELLAVRETHLEETTFPSECPYTPEQIMSDDYWPE